LRFYGECLPLIEEKNITAFLHTQFRQDWVVYASRLSADLTMSFTIWPVTPTVWPSPTTGCSRSPTMRSASAGRTMRMAGSNAP